MKCVPKLELGNEYSDPSRQDALDDFPCQIGEPKVWAGKPVTSLDAGAAAMRQPDLLVPSSGPLKIQIGPPPIRSCVPAKENRHAD